MAFSFRTVPETPNPSATPSKYPKAPRPRPHLRHLSRPPALRPRSRRQNLQTKIRPPRFESSRAKSAEQKVEITSAKSRLLRRSRIASFQATSKSPTSISTTTPTKGMRHKDLPLFSGAVSSGGLAGPARLALPLHKFTDMMKEFAHSGSSRS